MVYTKKSLISYAFIAIIILFSASLVTAEPVHMDFVVSEQGIIDERNSNDDMRSFAGGLWHSTNGLVVEEHLESSTSVQGTPLADVPEGIEGHFAAAWVFNVTGSAGDDWDAVLESGVYQFDMNWSNGTLLWTTDSGVGSENTSMEDVFFSHVSASPEALGMWVENNNYESTPGGEVAPVWTYFGVEGLDEEGSDSLTGSQGTFAVIAQDEQDIMEFEKLLNQSEHIDGLDPEDETAAWATFIGVQGIGSLTATIPVSEFNKDVSKEEMRDLLESYPEAFAVGAGSGYESLFDHPGAYATDTRQINAANYVLDKRDQALEGSFDSLTQVQTAFEEGVAYELGKLEFHAQVVDGVLNADTVGAVKDVYDTMGDNLNALSDPELSALIDLLDNYLAVSSTRQDYISDYTLTNVTAEGERKSRDAVFGMMSLAAEEIESAVELNEALLEASWDVDEEVVIGEDVTGSFTLENVGITSFEGELRYFFNEEATSMSVLAEDFTLAAGATKVVEVTVPVTEPAGTFTHSVRDVEDAVVFVEDEITVLAPAELSVTWDLPETVVVEETVSVDVTITNSGDVGFSGTLKYYFDGQFAKSSSLEHELTDFTGSETVSLSVPVTEPTGVFNHSIRDLENTTVYVEDEVTVLANNPIFELASWAYDDTVVIGENASSTIQITNHGGVSGVANLRYYFGGNETSQTAEVSLDAQETLELDFEVVVTEPAGTFDHSIRNDDGSETYATGEVTVLAPANLSVVWSVPSEVTVGDVITSTANITNTGDVAFSGVLQYFFNESPAKSSSLQHALTDFTGSETVSLDVPVTGPAGVFNHSVRSADGSVVYAQEEVVVGTEKDVEVDEETNLGEVFAPSNPSADAANISVSANTTLRAGTAEVAVDQDTVITSSRGAVNASQMRVSAEDSSSAQNTPSSSTARGVVQWGVVGEELSFSKPVTVRVSVDSSLNGVELDVYRSAELTTGWTQEGLDDLTCVVESGVCSFRTSKASYFAASQPPATSSSGGTTWQGGTSGFSSSAEEEEQGAEEVVAEEETATDEPAESVDAREEDDTVAAEEEAVDESLAGADEQPVAEEESVPTQSLLSGAVTGLAGAASAWWLVGLAVFLVAGVLYARKK